MHEIWFDYRTVWSRHAWVLAVGALGAVMVVLGIVGTAIQSPLLYLFIPGLAVLLAHHLIVKRRVG